MVNEKACEGEEKIIDYLSIRYGFYTECRGIRELELFNIRNGNVVGEINYNIKNRSIKGYFYNCNFLAHVMDDCILINDNSDHFNISILNKKLKITRNDKYELMLILDKDVNARFLRKAYYKKYDTLYEINISRNQTPLDFFKTIIGLASFGLYTPNFKGILSKRCQDLSEIEQRMLLYCAVLSQIYYFPFDYFDWT